MAKPIVVLYITQPKWTMEQYQKAQAMYDKKFNDYHVLVIPSSRNEILEIETINVKNLNAEQFSRFKKQLLETMPNPSSI